MTRTTNTIDDCAARHRIAGDVSPLGVRHHACECGNRYDGNARRVSIDRYGHLVPLGE